MTRSPAEPPARLVIAHSWWLAAELVRRHPELLIHEMHPGGGSYAVLALLSPPYMENATRVMLNRAGSIQVHHGTQAEVVSSWQDSLFESVPRRTLAAIEAAARWPVVEKSPASTSRALAYRFISIVLSLTATDRVHWDVRNDFIDSAGDWWPGDPETHGYVGQFALARADAVAAPRLGIWHEPESHFWAILRDDKPVALVSVDGIVYSDEVRVQLKLDYAKHDGKLMPSVVRVLGAFLP